MHRSESTPRHGDYDSTRNRRKPGENAYSRKIAAPGAAVDPAKAPADPRLSAVVSGPDTLPDAVRAGTLAMVRKATDSES